MFRIVGSFLGFFMGLPIFFPLGGVIGAIVGGYVGRTLDSFLFGIRRNDSNYRGAQDAYKKFYEQFYQNAQRTSYSGYTNGTGNGYTGYQNPGATEACYQNLGCTSTDSNSDIKKQYRKMAAKYHPDRVAGTGVSQAEVDRAEAKFKDIQDSYNRIKKERGI